MLQHLPQGVRKVQNPMIRQSTHAKVVTDSVDLKALYSGEAVR